MLTELEHAARVAGVKQVRRALTGGVAKKLFLAADADPGITAPLEELARAAGVPVERAESMRALGRACGIAVGAAVAADL